MYELKGVPQPPKKGLGKRLRRRKFGPRLDRKKMGLGPTSATIVNRAQGLRGGFRGGGRGGGSLLAKLMRKIMTKVGLRTPSLRTLFRKRSAGDGRNHGYGGVKKRNGRTGLAGR